MYNRDQKTRPAEVNPSALPPTGDGENCMQSEKETRRPGTDRPDCTQNNCSNNGKIKTLQLAFNKLACVVHQKTAIITLVYGTKLHKTEI